MIPICLYRNNVCFMNGALGSGEGGRLSQTSPLLAGAVGGIASTLGLGAETPDITPLTREQLQQALLYLLKVKLGTELVDVA